MTTAWIGFAGGIMGVLISAGVALRQTRLERKLLAEERAEEVLKRYREPLAAAAFDLQSRLYNILRKNFFKQFGGDHERCAIAENTTLFRLAQYFGWTEILRRDIQFLSFPEAADTQRVVALQLGISKRFLTSDDHHGLMIWSDEQRGIGEKMIVEEFEKVLCMGYARFRDEYETRFAPWCERLRGELQSTAGHDRLRDVQHLLCELVETLDPDRIRYTQDLDRA
jgi:hypothetical protein